MSGGIAYVLDIHQNFPPKVNTEMVELCPLEDPAEIAVVRGLIEDHAHYTGSDHAERILENFNHLLPRFVKVLPTDYKRVLEEEAARELEAKKNSYALPILPGIPMREEHEEAERRLAEIEAQERNLKEPSLLDLEDSIVDVRNERRKEKTVKQLDKLRGFMKYQRKTEKYRNPKKRTDDWKEFTSRLTTNELKQQTARCMDCGVPFCQSDTGCPISNIIPKWNELVFKDQWKDALDRLLMTSPFSEFTGRVCPAPCEAACVLGINELPVGIKRYGEFHS
jgi:glutamate synthase (NADPH/NADH)